MAMLRSVATSALPLAGTVTSAALRLNHQQSGNPAKNIGQELI
jgi:hypothetical protein